MKFFFSLLQIFFLFFATNSVFAKAPKKHKNTGSKPISFDYFLQINLVKDGCEKIVSGECFRRDRMRDEPYFHKTSLQIFDGKVFAKQFSLIDEEWRQTRFLEVVDGSHEFVTDQKNHIILSVKNGAVSELKLISGDLEKEKKSQSKCDLAEINYGFFQAYNSSQIFVKSAFFKDEENFDGLKEILFFVDKSKKTNVMALLKNSNQEASAVGNIELCRMPNSKEFLIKKFDDLECKTKENETVASCAKYSSCEDFFVVENCNVKLMKGELN